MRSYLEKQRAGYVMEMAATETLSTPRGAIAVKESAALVPEQARRKRSAGAGAKGERLYHWALIDDRCDEYGARLVAVAGRHWRVEESFQGHARRCHHRRQAVQES